jgi:hypothetical protein
MKKNYMDFKLDQNTTVAKLQSLLKTNTAASKQQIIQIIGHRLVNRYITPIENMDKKYRSGFLTMGISCLLIETLFSFYRGLKDTKNKSADMFSCFFEMEKEIFPGFNSISDTFYKNIRCGILHQAETTDGWRITQEEKVIVNNNNRTINPYLFFSAIKKSLLNYLNKLSISQLEDDIWINAKKKLSFIMNNCKPKT